MSTKIITYTSIERFYKIKELFDYIIFVKNFENFNGNLKMEKLWENCIRNLENLAEYTEKKYNKLILQNMWRF